MTQIIAPSEQRVIDESKYIIRRVKVDRSQNPQEVLNATGRKQYMDSDVVATMPHGEGDEVDVVVFKPEAWEYTQPGFMSDDDLEKCFERRDLIPADPYSVSGMNRDDPALADEKPHGTHWKDSDGKWCFVTFHRWDDGREVNVGRGDGAWPGYWWFAGVRE